MNLSEPKKIGDHRIFIDEMNAKTAYFFSTEIMTVIGSSLKSLSNVDFNGKAIQAGEIAGIIGTAMASLDADQINKLQSKIFKKIVVEIHEGGDQPAYYPLSEQWIFEKVIGRNFSLVPEILAYFFEVEYKEAFLSGKSRIIRLISGKSAGGNQTDSESLPT